MSFWQAISLQEFEALTCYQSPRLWGQDLIFGGPAFGIHDVLSCTRYLACLCAQGPRLQSLPMFPRIGPMLDLSVGVKVPAGPEKRIHVEETGQPMQEGLFFFQRI